MDNQTIGKQLKKTRQNRNMTLDELAEVTGVSKPMLGQIERGQSAPAARHPISPQPRITLFPHASYLNSYDHCAPLPQTISVYH